MTTVIINIMYVVHISGTSFCSNLPIATTLPPPPNTGTDHNLPPEQSTTIDVAVSHVSPSNSIVNTKPIIPTPTASSSDDDRSEGNAGLVTSDNTANLTITGAVVSLTLVTAILTIAITISAAVFLKVRKLEKLLLPLILT